LKLIFLFLASRAFGSAAMTERVHGLGIADNYELVDLHESAQQKASSLSVSHTQEGNILPLCSCWS
jgi:hypothetical protein